MLNFALFVIGSFVLGGSSSVSFPPKDGRYFLSERGHVTEVSRGTYLYSKAHLASLWISIPLIVVAALLAWRIEEKARQDIRPAFPGGDSPGEK